jgi:Fur family ferric uptake transcriptional regulator
MTSRMELCGPRILAEKGLIRHIQPAWSPAHYADRGVDNHHRPVCHTCGRMVDLYCAVGATPA